MKRICRASHQREQFLGLHSAEFLVLPLSLTQCNGCEKIERLANAAAVVCLEIPQVDSDAFAKCRQQHQPIKIPVAVTPGFRPR